MKKEKKAFKGWIDPMATPYQYNLPSTVIGKRT